MSVVLICFPGAPKVSPEAVKREAELDKYLEARVEGTKRLGFVVQNLKGRNLYSTAPFLRVRLAH